VPSYARVRFCWLSVLVLLAAGSLLACNAIVGNFEREVDDGAQEPAVVGTANPTKPTARSDASAAADPGSAKQSSSPPTSTIDGGGDAADKDAGRCGKGPSMFEDPATGHCYELFTTGKSWKEAETACVGKGGHLAALTTEAEKQLVKTALGASPPKMWIGASDIAVEGTFAWTSGEAFSYASWLPGEPNNSGPEDCVNMKPSDDYRWNDGECDEIASYLCER
jgi:hypothetical protein